MKLIGILLIGFGIFALVAGGIRYTDRDTIIDLGPIEAQVEREETLPLAPIVGIVSVAAGIALVVAGARMRTRA